MTDLRSGPRANHGGNAGICRAYDDIGGTQRVLRYQHCFLVSEGIVGAPADLPDLEWWDAPESKLYDRAFCRKVGPRRGVSGWTVKADPTRAQLPDPKGVLDLLAVDGLALKHMPLTREHHTVFEVDVGHRAVDL